MASADCDAGGGTCVNHVASVAATVTRGQQGSDGGVVLIQAGSEYHLTPDGDALRGGGVVVRRGIVPAHKRPRTLASDHAPATRPIAEVVDTNGKPGEAQRWLVRWEGEAASANVWVKEREVPPRLMQRDVDVARSCFNTRLLPSLCDPGATGVESTSVSEGAASRCAMYLKEHWRDGSLRLNAFVKCQGYTTYGKTIQSHDAEEQSLNTLLITHALLPLVQQKVPGFEEMATELAGYLQQRYDTVVELYFAHGLRQGRETLGSTAFDVHQDTEDFEFIKYTVVVKLTPDEPGEPPSQMRVVGAGQHYHYGARAGAAGLFLAPLYHASVPPVSKTEHYKMAFFFRTSERQVRRAAGSCKRTNGSTCDHDVTMARPVTIT